MVVRGGGVTCLRNVWSSGPAYINAVIQHMVILVSDASREAGVELLSVWCTYETKSCITFIYFMSMCFYEKYAENMQLRHSLIKVSHKIK